MKIFKYSIMAKIIYRYANIPATILLLLNSMSAIGGMYESWYYIFPLLIDLLIIYLLNRFYLKSYRLFPFIISANNEKLICSDYFFSSKEIVLYHKDITKITGGIFSGNTMRPVYFWDEKNGIKIGINNHMKNYDKLITIVLSNVNQGLYNELLDKAKSMQINIQNKRRNKKAK